MLWCLQFSYENLPLAKESDTQEKLEILAKDPLGYKVMKEIVCGTVNE